MRQQKHVHGHVTMSHIEQAGKSPYITLAQGYQATQTLTFAAQHLGASCHRTVESIHESAQMIYKTLQHHVSSEV